MHRVVLAALACGVTALSAAAQPISLDPVLYPSNDSRTWLESPYRPAESGPQLQAVQRAPVRVEAVTQPLPVPSAVSRPPAEQDVEAQALPQPVQPAQTQVAQYHAPRRPNLGGGFIEFLFGGVDEPRRRQQPVAAPPPAAEPMAAPMERIYAPSQHASVPPQRMIRPVPAMDPRFLPTVIDYTGKEKAGTIIINTNERFLYLVQEGGTAKRYGIGVGRPGFTWAGVHKVTSKREWPDWHPPDEMLKRQPYLPTFVAGGPDNPLGARALYLGSTLYRVHGSNEPWTIGRAVSSGCIRMRNEDVIDLYNRVDVGAKVVVI